jgi:hypothetical protein
VNFPSSKQFRPVKKQGSENMKISGWDCDFDFWSKFSIIANSLIFINCNIYFETSLGKLFNSCCSLKKTATKINKTENTQVKMLWTEFKLDKTGSVLQQPICYGA